MAEPAERAKGSEVEEDAQMAQTSAEGEDDEDAIIPRFASGSSIKNRVCVDTGVERYRTAVEWTCVLRV